ncbi:MAG TPA: hypothetical protein VLT59_03160 [Steroidobacteraceae bacterium]|nr:hypothetical protein [Steroidobacteraceae bacterium]
MVMHFERTRWLAARSAIGAAALSLTLVGAAQAQQTQTEQPRYERQQSQPMQPQTKRQSQQMRQQQAWNTQAQQRDESSAVIIGQVVETRDVDIDRPVKSTHRLIKVQTREGRTAIVDIGNAESYAEVDFERGDRIMAVGKQARINNRPVLFAKSVGELYSVGDHMRTQGQITGQSRSQMQQNQQGMQQGRAAGQQQDQRQAGISGQQRGQQGQQDSDLTVLYLFESENLADDDYGVYDEDFAWETNDQWYSDWNEYDADRAWDDDYEQAHYDLWGYDDAGEWGFWDW